MTRNTSKQIARLRKRLQNIAGYHYLDHTYGMNSIIIIEGKDEPHRLSWSYKMYVMNIHPAPITVGRMWLQKHLSKEEKTALAILKLERSARNSKIRSNIL
jgi:hypothetical protein